MSRQSDTFIKLAIVAAGLLFVCWASGLGTPGMFNFPRLFSKDVWRESADLSNKARCSMMLDLRHRIGIVGKTRAEIEELLGPPDDSTSEATEYLLCDQTFFLDAYLLEIRWLDDVSTSAQIGTT